LQRRRLLPFLQWCVCIFLPLFQFQKSPLSSQKKSPLLLVLRAVFIG
jgi:hypothetical protein